MNVINNKKYDCVPFGQIDVGECFLYCGKIYMVCWFTDCDGDKYFGVSLSSGELVKIKSDELVECFDIATVTVE